MTKQLPNVLILEEGENHIIIKRAGVKYKLLTTFVASNMNPVKLYFIQTFVINPAIDSDVSKFTHKLMFKDRKFISEKND